MVLSYLLPARLLLLENGRGRAFLQILSKTGALLSGSEIVRRFEIVAVRGVLVLLTV